MDALRNGLNQLETAVGSSPLRRRGGAHGAASEHQQPSAAGAELAALRGQIDELRGMQTRSETMLARVAADAARTAEAAGGLGRSCYLMRRELRELRQSEAEAEFCGRMGMDKKIEKKKKKKKKKKKSTHNRTPLNFFFAPQPRHQ
jgi:hypothetical protein